MSATGLQDSPNGRVRGSRGGRARARPRMTVTVARFHAGGAHGRLL